MRNKAVNALNSAASVGTLWMDTVPPSPTTDGPTQMTPCMSAYPGSASDSRPRTRSSRMVQTTAPISLVLLTWPPSWGRGRASTSTERSTPKSTASGCSNAFGTACVAADVCEKDLRRPASSRAAARVPALLESFTAALPCLPTTMRWPALSKRVITALSPCSPSGSFSVPVFGLRLVGGFCEYFHVCALPAPTEPSSIVGLAEGFAPSKGSE
mmetsp:Transcript_45352/g.145459  ORF Transcript_45352/g.145459 Transcript_45352/m.145459 type:complete len:213 (-) Transcript_45352:2576-3214(-)